MASWGPLLAPCTLLWLGGPGNAKPPSGGCPFLGFQKQEIPPTNSKTNNENALEGAPTSLPADFGVVPVIQKPACAVPLPSPPGCPLRLELPLAPSVPPCASLMRNVPEIASTAGLLGVVFHTTGPQTVQCHFLFPL